jgi:hypothetical protein
MIGIPGGNTWDKTAEDFYFFDSFIQTVLAPLDSAGIKWHNTCFAEAEKYGYNYYNNGNGCYAVPCNTSLYKSVFFQLDTENLFEVTPEDYILQECKVDVT